MVKSTFAGCVVASTPGTVLVNVGRKNWVEVAVRLPTCTLIGPKVAPVGRVTVN